MTYFKNNEDLLQDPNKLRTILRRLQKEGIGPEHLLAIPNASIEQMSALKAFWPRPADAGSAIVYDAVAMSRILGITCECNDPVPEAADGEIVVYYGGWDLPTLRTSAARTEAHVAGPGPELV